MPSKHGRTPEADSLEYSASHRSPSRRSKDSPSRALSKSIRDETSRRSRSGSRGRRDPPTTSSQLDFDWNTLTNPQPTTPQTPLAPEVDDVTPHAKAPTQFTPTPAGPDYYNPKFQSRVDDTPAHLSALPTVILLVAESVKLIRNNSVPMLQVQLEIIQNAMGYDNDMCMLGLNDVIYLAPEYTPSDYDTIYPKLCTGSEFEEYKPFFEHFAEFEHVNGDRFDTVPERMMHLHKNLITAIDRDSYEPDLRGKASINLKHVPNGHYTAYYLRIGQPIGINSRLKVLGRAKGIFVNLNRDKISTCKKPQLDFNHSSGRLSR